VGGPEIAAAHRGQKVDGPPCPIASAALSDICGDAMHFDAQKDVA